jgi:choline-sulfatase
MPRRETPNILCIMSDEHNAGVTGCYGNPTVRTSNLDRLAERGVTFDCAYTNSPLCVPARLAFTAGKYVSRVSAWSNHCWLPSDDISSLPRIMTQVGYDSLLCGKMHYDETRRYGFTEIGGNFNQSHKRGRCLRRAADDETINTKSRDGRFSNFYPGDSSKVLQHDRQVTAGALEFLSKRNRTDKPFFLCVGYLSPHFPLIVPERYWRSYEGKVPMPNLPPGSVESQPLNYHHLRRGFGVVETDAEIVRKGRELYYGLTEWLDEEIGKVLATLSTSEVADDTIVIYTSDHGENIGEHHLWWKNCMYDHAARVPLIVSYPQRWMGGRRRRKVCSLADLVQTIAEIAGAEAPDDWDGDSMCNWMDDPGAEWKDFAVSEYYGHNVASGFVMLREGSYKYVYHTPPDDYNPPERELYDLQTDPGEFANLAHNPRCAERIEQMHALMVKELGEDPDETEQRCRADYAKGYER